MVGLPEHEATIAETYVESWGLRPAFATHAEEASLAVAHSIKERDPYLVVLLNSELPDADPYEYVNQLREATMVADTKILLLLSIDDIGQSENAVQSGFDGTITRPIKQSSLFNSLLSLFEPRAVSSQLDTLELNTRREPPSTRFVLVAEDNIVNQEVAVLLLEELGFNAHVVSNGRMALEASNDHNCQLILMDCQMPDMDGFEATMSIRQREKQSGDHIPIIAMTAHAMEGDRENCLQAGMDDYLSKPVTISRLREVVQRWLSYRESHKEVTYQSLPAMTKADAEALKVESLRNSQTNKVPASESADESLFAPETEDELSATQQRKTHWVQPVAVPPSIASPKQLTPGQSIRSTNAKIDEYDFSSNLTGVREPGPDAPIVASPAPSVRDEAETAAIVTGDALARAVTLSDQPLVSNVSEKSEIADSADSDAEDSARQTKTAAAKTTDVALPALSLSPDMMTAKSEKSSLNEPNEIKGRKLDPNQVSQLKKTNSQVAPAARKKISAEGAPAARASSNMEDSDMTSTEDDENLEADRRMLGIGGNREIRNRADRLSRPAEDMLDEAIATAGPPENLRAFEVNRKAACAGSGRFGALNMSPEQALSEVDMMLAGTDRAMDLSESTDMVSPMVHHARRRNKPTVTAGETDISNLFDYSALESTFGPQSAKKFLNLFASMTPSLLSRLETAISGKRFEAAKAAAHELKGMCATIHITSMVDLCRGIEESAEAANWSNAERLLADLKKTFNNAETSIKNL
jgi:CheY-like chemotaxis protein/HPt (histidine-containing phosphotransfer) domain-containing protein